MAAELNEERLGRLAVGANALTVLLCEPRPRFAIALTRVLESARSVCVVGRADTPACVMEMVSKLRPQVVVMNMSWPGSIYHDLAKQLCKALSMRSIGVVVLAPASEDACLREALTTGAHAMLAEPFHPHDPLLAVLHAGLMVEKQNAMLTPDQETTIKVDRNLATGRLARFLDWADPSTANELSARLRSDNLA